MSYINKYLRNFKPYKVASHKIWQTKPEERGNILKLDWNESTISPSPLVKARLESLLKTDFLNLYPSTSNEQLYKLLSNYVELPVENIQYFASSDSLHEYISKMYITVGDPVLILWPSYDNFRLTAEVAGANVSYFELTSDFRFQKEEFEKMIMEKSPSLVYICNPNNPTGLSLEPDYILHLLNKFPSTMFLIDEAYIEFCPEYTCKDLVLKNNNILISRTMSKAFGLANVRFGYLIASAENIRYISTIRNPKNITTFAQEAALGALQDVGYMQKYVNEVNKAKAFFVEEINKKCSPIFKAFDSKANFVIVKCKSFSVKNDILYFLEENNIFVRNISQSPIVKDCIRITIGTLDQMKRVLLLLKQYVSEKASAY